MTKNDKILYPVIGNYVTLLANSSVLGGCKIGNYVTIGAGTMIKGEEIPDYSLVFGISPNLEIRVKTKDEMKKYYADKWIEFAHEKSETTYYVIFFCTKKIKLYGTLLPEVSERGE